MVYKYKWNGYSRSVSADIVGCVVEELEDKYGSVTSEMLLDAARSDDSPIHSLFEWDDTKAAEAYRVQQSRVIINSLIRVENKDGKPKEFKAFVNVEHASAKANYKNTVKALSKEETKRIVLQKAYKELLSFKKKYESLSELSGIFREINKAGDFIE